MSGCRPRGPPGQCGMLAQRGGAPEAAGRLRLQCAVRKLMRALGIDFGEKRIGVAVSDPHGRVAVPLVTLVRRNDRAAVAQIAEIARREAIGRLVLGEPLGLDGTSGPQAERVRRFGARLAAATGLPLCYVDESLTSHEAAARLRAAGADARRHPERIDATALIARR